MSDPVVLHTTDELGVCRLSLNRPDRHNAINREMIDALQAALESLAGRTRMLVLGGEGRSFCAGADLDWMRQSVTLSPADNQADAMALSNLLHTLDTFPAPVLARVQGVAIGGGAGLVSCCDSVIASHPARFGFSEVRLGLIPATISPYVLRAIGSRAARHWFLSGARFDAAEAHRLGLVHQLCSDDEMDAAVETHIGELLIGGAEAQRESKRLIRDVDRQTNDEALREQLSSRLAAVRSGAEAQEGLAAFLDRRRPAWCGEAVGSGPGKE